MQDECLTNNPMVISSGNLCVKKIEGDALEVMKEVKRAVIMGYRLISHPLTGSIRPDVSPYKSIIISGNPKILDIESLQLIENAIEYTQNLYKTVKERKWDKDSLADFQFIDFCLINNLLGSDISKECRLWS